MKNVKEYVRLLPACLIFAAIALMGFAKTGIRVSDFQLKNVDGKMVSLKDYPDAKGFMVVFTCNHCPFAKLYFQRLNDLNKKYKGQGVPVIAICSIDTMLFEEDTYAKMQEKARKEHCTFPYLSDGAQTVAKNYGAQKTPHAYLIWKEKGEWVIKYNGAIDDNGAEPQKVQHPYLATAVEAMLGGKEVAVKEVKSVGCQIQYR